MPVILGLLAIIGVAYFWISRARNAADMAQELVGVAGDVMSAARRFGFRRKYNEHPVDSVDDPDLAIAAAGVAFLELSGMPTTEARDALSISLQSHLNLSHDKAQEALILGRWLVNECGTAPAAVTRTTKRIIKLRGQDSFQVLLAVMNDVGKANAAGLSDQQRDALADIARIYKIS